MSLRQDLQLIIDLVPQGATVLDVGSGEGDLLAGLQEQKQVRGRGIEFQASRVNRCIARGLSVVQGDANKDLEHYPDAGYDVAILSLTLQTLENPKNVLEQLARIGREVIVSVPNFGYWSNRLYLLMHGRMPVTKALTYEWYDTPNIHFCTVQDFIVLCQELNLSVEQKTYLPKTPLLSLNNSDGWANCFAQQGIFTLRRQ